MLKLNIDNLARMKAVREKREINANVISIETGIPYPTIRRYFNSDTESVKLDKLEILREYFDCELEDLFTEDETEIESNARTGIRAAVLVAH